MSVLPDGKLAKIEFCEQHLSTFSANAVAIGTTAAAVTDLTTKTTAARDAFNAQKEAQDAAKSATNTYRLAVEAMTTAVADIIKQVKTKAAIAGDSVYSLANIPVPATPGPIGELGKPTDFQATHRRARRAHADVEERQPARRDRNRSTRSGGASGRPARSSASAASGRRSTPTPPCPRAPRASRTRSRRCARPRPGRGHRTRCCSA
jgi:hypothetical protein